jgi:hypothetical protein
MGYPHLRVSIPRVVKKLAGIGRRGIMAHPHERKQMGTLARVRHRSGESGIAAPERGLGGENRILRAHLPSRMRLSDPQRSTLAEIGKRLGRKALAPVACVAKPDTILPGAGIEIGERKALFKVVRVGTRFGVTADGQRFLMREAPEQIAPDTPEITVVLNWFAELGQASRPVNPN